MPTNDNDGGDPSAAAALEDVVVDPGLLDNLQTMLDHLVEEEYKEAADLCQSILREFQKGRNNRNTNAISAELRFPLIELVMQCYLHLENYAKVREFTTQQRQHAALSSSESIKLLESYTSYRLKEYKAVIKKLSGSSGNNGGVPAAKQLLAQALFHGSSPDSLNQSKALYRDLMDDISGKIANDDDDATMSLDEMQDDRTELWTNYLAASVAGATPLVAEQDGADVLDEIDGFLSSLNPSSQTYSYDLASNFGIYQCITGGTTTWLEQANEHAQQVMQSSSSSSRDKEVASILGNAVWSRQWIGNDFDVEEHQSDYKYVVKHGTTATQAVSKFNQALLSRSSGGDALEKPDEGWNLLQVRLYWYNRAVQHYRSKDYSDCRKACQSLQKTLSSSSEISGNAWWESRCGVILAYVAWKESGIENDDESRQKAVEMLRKRQEHLSSLASAPAIDNALGYVQLHLHHLQNVNESKEKETESMVELLTKTLPASIRKSRAVEAMLSSLSGSSSALEQTSSSTDKKEATIVRADNLLSTGNYEEAAAMYQELLPASVKECTPRQIQEKLRQVQALAQSSPEEAAQLWDSLKEYVLQKNGGEERDLMTSEVDVELLESKELPKSKTASSSSTLALKKLIATAHDESDGSKNDRKKSKEAVLRRRARQREEYLEKLSSKGLYNTSRPVKANPERWIPKRDRGGRRGGGGGGGYNKSAQGSAVNADAMKKLDAAARKAGGSSNESSGPSTANMKVSSGGRKGGRRR